MQASRESLPQFIYHPNPIATRSVIESDEACSCCERERGFVCAASPFSARFTYDQFCPWCVADGSAAENFYVLFVEENSLVKQQIPATVVEVVTRRTLPYSCFQGPRWMACCNDACEFQGLASLPELQAISAQELQVSVPSFRWPWQEWERFLKRHKPEGEVGVYRFTCRHCKRLKFHMDGG